jgi:uncharacterized protein with GYD domain
VSPLHALTRIGYQTDRALQKEKGSRVIEIAAWDRWYRIRAQASIILDENEGGNSMPFYLTRFSYTPATWAKLMKNPEDRRDAAKQYIEAVGGKLHGFWYALGEHDGYNLWEAPDNVSIAATAIAIGAGGALSSIQTTALLTVEETLVALQKASSIKYRPPGDKGA